MASDDAVAVQAFVSAGLGIAVIPGLAVSVRVRGVTTRDLRGPGPVRQSGGRPARERLPRPRDDPDDRAAPARHAGAALTGRLVRPALGLRLGPALRPRLWPAAWLSAQASIRGRTSPTRRSSWATSSPSGQTWTREQPAAAYRPNRSAQCSGVPTQTRSRSSAGSRRTSGASTSTSTRSRVRRVVGDPRPHRRHRSGEVGSAEPGALLRESTTSLGERLRRGVVRRREPAVAPARDAPQPGRRAPAGDPEGHRRGWFDRPGTVEDLDPPGRQRPGAEQPAQDAQGLLEVLPTVVERHPGHGVVRRRGAGPDAGDDPARREGGQGGERGGELGGSAQRGQRDRRGEVHPAGAVGDRGQEGRPVGPGPVEGQVVVGRDGRWPSCRAGWTTAEAAYVGGAEPGRNLRQAHAELRAAASHRSTRWG